MLQLTKSAADQVRTAAAQSGITGMALRIAAHRQLSGAIEYIMGFDEINEDDIRYQSEGVYILMNPDYAPLLDSTVLDFVELDTGEGKQFIFINPKDPQYVPPKD